MEHNIKKVIINTEESDYCICNKCGETVSKNKANNFKHKFGYFSKFDMDRLNLTLCNGCLDEMTELIIANCKISPLIEYNPYN